MIEEAWRLFPHTYARKISDKAWQPFNYLRYISLKIVEALNKGDGRIIVNMPPRHGKSVFMSRWVPTWFLDLYPDRRVILCSYESDVAAGWGREVRNTIVSSEDVEVRIAQDSSAVNRWHTSAGGQMVTAGAGGPITGKGGNLLIIDDMIKNWEQATSPTQLQKHVDWFKSTFYTRKEPSATIIVLMTRWCENDLAGYLINEHPDDWEAIVFPAIAEKNDPLGRKPGEALCPSRFGSKDLNIIKNSLGTLMFSGLYQQNPINLEGEIFKNSWFQYYTSLPEKMEIIQSWDLAFKDNKSSSYVCGQVWGKKNANYYLIDQVRKRISFTKSIQALINTVDKFPETEKIYIEEKANGAAVIDVLKDKIPGIIAINPKGSKYARAVSVSPLFEAGNIFLPHESYKPWISEYTKELISFPNSANNDQVDATSQALEQMRANTNSLIGAVAPGSLTKASMLGGLT